MIPPSQPEPDFPPQAASQDLFAGIQVPSVFQADASVVIKPCALCGRRKGRRLYMQAHFPVVVCGGCGLVYADEHFREQDLLSFYSGDYYQRAYVCHPREIDRKIADEYVRAFNLVDTRLRGGRLLDFGSARGTFLGELGDRGFGSRWRLEGLDLNADEVGMGRAQGREIHCGTLAEAGLERGAYDAVTAFSVLEHLQDPIGDLRRLAELLRPGGRLLALVPSGQCLIIRLAVLLARVLGKRVRRFTDNVFHEEHLYYFTPPTMRRALSMAGLETELVFFHPSYLETHPTGPLVAAGAWTLRFASWALRMQTMLGVLARKPAGLQE